MERGKNTIITIIIIIITINTITTVIITIITRKMGQAILGSGSHSS